MVDLPLTSLRERKKTATKERIYRSALALFREKGFGAATVEEIAGAAEVAKGTFFNYFPSKESVLTYFGERQTLHAAEDIAGAVSDSGLTIRQKLESIFAALAAGVEEDPDLTRMALFEVLKVPEVIANDHYREIFHNLLTALLGEGQARGEVHPALQPDHMAAAIEGVYFQQVFEWARSKKPYSLQRQLESTLDVLWTGLGNQGN